MSFSPRVAVLLAVVVPAVLGACSDAGDGQRSGEEGRAPGQVSGSGTGEAVSQADKPPNLTRLCESARPTNGSPAVRPADLAFPESRRIGDEAPEKLGRVVGLEGGEGADSAIWVADAFRPGIVVFSQDGTFRTSFGEQGRGPGDFAGMGVGSHGGTADFDQLDRLGDDLLTVAGNDHIHLFTSDGDFVDRVETMFSLNGPFAHRHLAGWSDREVLFVRTAAGRFGSADPDSIPPQHVMKLVRLSRTGQSFETSVEAVLHNSIVRLHPYDGFPPNSYFQRHFARTWDAAGERLLATYAFDHHRVCLFGDDLQMVAAYQIDAPTVEVDDEVRQAALERSRQAFGDSPPMAGGTWEDFYDVWPESFPRYTDIVVSPDSTVWAERPTGLDRWAVDLFRPGEGYVGTLRSLSGRLPVDFVGECPVWTTTDIRKDEPGAGFYGLEIRCPG